MLSRDSLVLQDLRALLRRLKTMSFLNVEDPGQLPPGTPPTCKSTVSSFWILTVNHLCADKFEGPWFTTQLFLSSTIGVTSFLLFSYCRTRWPLLFAPRTKLKGWCLGIGVVFQCRLLQSQRFLASRSSHSSSILRMDSTHHTNLGIHCPSDSRTGRSCCA